MTHFRGLRTELCPNCKKLSPHKTLYVRIDSHRRSKRLRLFRVCTACNALNHVVQPTYNLGLVPPELPSPLVTNIVDALRSGPLDFDGLIQSLRRHSVGIRHVFKSDVAMAMEYLKRLGVVSNQVEDLTERTLAELRSRPSCGRHLGPCPAEANEGIARKSLVSLYVQRRLQAEGGDGSHVGQLRLSQVGVLCVQCEYYRIEMGSITRP